MLQMARRGRFRGSFIPPTRVRWYIAVALMMFTMVSTARAAAVNVEHARIRLLPGNLPLAGYMTIVNQGDDPIRLIGASSPGFAMVHLHRSMEEGGRSRMVPVDGIDIDPGDSAQLQPGGYHLMLMKRTGKLQVGDEVPITLLFGDGSRITIPFTVQPASTR